MWFSTRVSGLVLMVAVVAAHGGDRPSPFSDGRKKENIESGPAPKAAKAGSTSTSRRASAVGDDVPAAPAPAAPVTPVPVSIAEGESSGRACFGGTELDGRKTASGEVFSSNELTAAHASFPLGSRVKVTNLRNQKTVIVRINDRFRNSKNIIQVTRRAAEELDFISSGYATVKLSPAE